LIAITKAYDLAREVTSRVIKYPRSHRFVLGDRTITAAYDLLDLLVTAKYTRLKIDLLDRANLTLERMRFQVRLAHDERIISVTQYEILTRQIEEVGRLIGGWRKSQTR
jgi:hypothetical protein